MYTNNHLYHVIEARYSGLMVNALIKQSRFEPWPRMLCCVLGQDNNSHCASLPPKVCKWLSIGEFNAGGSPAMD